MNLPKEPNNRPDPSRLVIIDPASAIPGLIRCLPALVELARQTNCAILLTTKHALGTQPPTLASTIVATEAGIPTIQWQGERDHDQLSRLRFLQHSDSPQRIPDILQATSYDREAGRKMLLRMQQAGELVSPARGLYTTAHHPCLLHCSNDPLPVPHVPNTPNTSDVPNVSYEIRLKSDHQSGSTLSGPPRPAADEGNRYQRAASPLPGFGEPCLGDR